MSSDIPMENKDKLKILYIPAWYPNSKNPVEGIFVKEYAKAAALYNDIVVIYKESFKRDFKKIWDISSDEYNENIREIGIVHKKFSIRVVNYLIYFWSIWYIFRKLLKEGWRPDIIHAHVYSAGIPGVILGKIYKIPVIITEHWSGFPRHTLNKFKIFEARFVMNRANMILPVSKDLEKAIKSYGIKNRFEVIPNVVNTEMFYPSKKKRNNNDKKRILFVALLNPIKGVPYLLQALAKLRKKREDFVLDIVGDGPNRKEYEELTKKLGLKQLVRFHGLKTKQEVAEFMRNCNFFVLASLWENLPCVLIEAMASGLPIVSTKVGGIPEIINEKVGILVPPGDVDALTKAIDYMLGHWQDYSSEKISQYAKDNFSYEAVGKSLNNIYNDVMRNVGKKI